jgi:hypothetical protein
LCWRLVHFLGCAFTESESSDMSDTTEGSGLA